MAPTGQNALSIKRTEKDRLVPGISVIIVNYNGGDFLRQCVQSVRASNIFAQIVVVDNASPDASLEQVTDMPDVRIIRNRANFGFAAACNIGARATFSPVLLFLNPDCCVAPDAIRVLTDTMLGGDDIGMAGGFVVNPDGTEQAGGRRAVPTPWRSFVRAFGLARLSRRWPRLFFDFHLHKQPLPADSIEVEAISGACMLVRREALEQAGNWDEDYFLHCEDLDLCMSLRQKGWKVMFVPTAKVVHALGVCSRSRPIFVEWHKHKGMIRFYRKFFRHQYPGLLMVLVMLGVWLRFAGVATYHLAKRVVGHD